MFLEKINQDGKPISEEKSDLKGLSISFGMIIMAMVGIPYGVTFLFPTYSVWRGPPPKRPRHILKLFCNFGYRREAVRMFT